MANKIAILGSNGVIGQFLSTAFPNDFVFPINRQILDLNDSKQVFNHFKYNYYDVVINCAANINSNFDAPVSVATDNLTMFSNIYQSKGYFGRYIQFCSGAAFDRTRSINQAKEDDILFCAPKDAYGLSKNIISRICLNTDNFFTVRIFGTFYHRENTKRLLPKILSGDPIVINDRYFDYFYIEDLVPIINYLIDEFNPKYTDINAVYPEKLLLSTFVRQFCEIHNIDQSHISVVENNELHNYTGSAERYSSLNLPAIGIENGMKKYK